MLAYAKVYWDRWIATVLNRSSSKWGKIDKTRITAALDMFDEVREEEEIEAQSQYQEEEVGFLDHLGI